MVNGIDPRSVMCLWTPTAVTEPAGTVPAVASLAVTPNPLVSGPATLRYSLPGTGPATVTLYDVAGRPVLRRALAAQKNGAVRLDARELTAGEYTAAQKLVVQR